MSQHTCVACGSIFLGEGNLCRICKSKESGRPITVTSSLPAIIPDDLKIGIYITTMNHWSVTRNALISLKENTKYPHDTYILDGASTDGTPDKTRDEFPWVTVLELDRPYWIAYAWNRVLEHALAHGYDYIGILNNDLLFGDKWLQQTLRCFIEDPDVGYASPIQVTSKGNIREIGKNRYGHFDTTLYCTKPVIVPVVWMPGACILLRREAVEEVGLFDENYFYSDDEVDYCIRLWHNGWKVVSNPLARITHLVSVTIDKHRSKRDKAKEIEDTYGVKYYDPKEYFYQKWTVSDLDSIMETIKSEQVEAGVIERRPSRIWK